MKNLINRLLQGLNISGRDGVILTLSLLLAFSVWTIHNLSLRYNANLKAKILAVCPLDGYEDVSVISEEVNARGRTTGYKVIKSYLKARRPVKITFPNSHMQHYSDDRFFVTGDKLNEYSHLIFGEDVTIEHYLTDTLFFRFPKVNHKKVPVRPVSMLTFRGQYINTEPLKLLPDSVVIEGEPHLIESIRQVYTAPIRHYDIHENTSGMVALEPIRGVDVQTREAYYSMDVTRFVEIVKNVHVLPINVPHDKTMLVFPSTVQVKFRFEFPLSEYYTDDISMVIDYEEFKSSLGGNCVVRAGVMPKGLISYEVDPVAVRCVEEGR